MQMSLLQQAVCVWPPLFSHVAELLPEPGTNVENEKWTDDAVNLEMSDETNRLIPWLNGMAFNDLLLCAFYIN